MMRKGLFIILFLLPAMLQLNAQSVNIIESSGWLESASVKWQPVDTADGYGVYYSGEGITDKKIDDQLIRSYSSFFRADILGLKAGKYTIKVVPEFSGEEGEGSISDTIAVMAHDRTGFAFWPHHLG